MAGLTKFIKNAATTLKENGVFQGSIDVYLQNNMHPVGIAIHWAAILASCYTDERKLLYPKTKSLAEVADLGSAVASIQATTAGEATIKWLNSVYEATKDPNIEGIPIVSPSIQVSREVEVSDYGVIVDSGFRKQNVVDNATPKPRTWEIKGYITSKWAVDVGMILKPSLQMQSKILDAYAQSRKPLWFKTDEFEFVKVQITNLTFSRKAEIMNAYEVSMTLKEFIPLEIFTKGPSWLQAVLKTVGI